MKIASIFISKNLEELTELSAFCDEHDIHLEAKSFITFEEINEEFNPNFDIYFFGSKNSFDFFLKRNLSLVHKKIAVIGESTKKHIETLGYEVDFYGKEAGNPKSVAEDLQNWLKNRKISFFQSDISKRSIARFISDTQKEEFVIYRTKGASEKLCKSFDLYVFTSPSNVESFFKTNALANDAKVISWGKSTEEILHQFNVPILHTLKNSSIRELVAYLSENQ